MSQMTAEQAMKVAVGHHRAGRLREAEGMYRWVLGVNANCAEAFLGLGAIAAQVGKRDDAILCWQRALMVRPGYAEAYSNLGNAYLEKGLVDQAIESFKRALELKPGMAETLNNLGNAWKEKGEFDRAIGLYREAIADKPGFAEPHYHLGIAWSKKGDPDRAIESYRQAIALRGDFAEAYNGLGHAYRDRGEIGEAIANYRKAIQIRPGLVEAHDSLLVGLHYLPESDSKGLLEEARVWNAKFAKGFEGLIQAHENEHGPGRRLRVGYVSADFRNHASAFFLHPLFAAHNREQFELFCYSQTAMGDEVTEALKGRVDHWRVTVGVSDVQMMEMIRGDGIDILVDLKLHTMDNRLPAFAGRPAPVQVTWLGYPGTTGMEAMDYRLSDPYLDPPGEGEDYSEKTVRLADSFWCYDPIGAAVEVNELPLLRNGFVTFGCLNNICKVNDEVLELWGKVLEAVPGSRLILLAPEGAARERIVERLKREGVEAGRVEFVGRQSRGEYLKTYQRMDLGLDTFPYNGHTTSLDALWMGVPVVTLAGRTAVGRAGVSQLSNLGMKELIANSKAEYVRIARELGGDLARLVEMRAALRGRMEGSPLMDAGRFARAVEEAYRWMWGQRHSSTGLTEV
jgi:protein O-GlcNAc transferase